MSEDMDKRQPEADIQADDTPDVEAHKKPPSPDFGATEEGPDVEAHRFTPKAKP